jgi:hypothetical protein
MRRQAEVLVLVAVWALLTGPVGENPAKADDVVRERPAVWKDLVSGGQFKDLFLPMPVRGGLSSDTWGGDNVKPRDVTNGIETPEWSYWCGYPVTGDDGRYHLYTARWPEDEPRGHFGYFDSEIVHAIAEDPVGPYHYEDTVGPGHNPELYRTVRGEYILYSTHGRFYSSKNLDGPWKAGTYNFDKRERYAFKNYVNFSFAPRADGSFIAVSRRGYVWASPDGREDWYEVSAESVYPNVPGIFEDPVMWKDDIQYHIIVNDWKGRIAYYLRSKDGFHWTTEPGEAYVPGIARYEDGTVSDWYKFERIRFLQDEHGRPTHAHFAVIDCSKHDDQPNDIHNSKLIIIPMTVARRLEVLNSEAISTETESIRVRVKAEEGFDPHTDLDVDSLRFGASSEVNYGRGGRVAREEKDSCDLILEFSGSFTGFTPESFAGKLLGKSANGELVFGWARLPGVNPIVPLLSPLSPKFEFTHNGLEAYVEIQNFGQTASKEASVSILICDEELARGRVRALRPFEKSIVRLVCTRALAPGSKHEVTVQVDCEGLPSERFTKKPVLPRN